MKLFENISKHLKPKKHTKGFRVEFPDEYAFSPYPGPKPPDTAVIDALVAYSEEMNEPIEFISTTMPIHFCLHTKNGNELYQATVVHGNHPRNLCYFIACTQV